MKFTDLSHLCEVEEYKKFARNEWCKLDSKPGLIDIHIYPSKIPDTFKFNVWRMKDDKDALGYLYILNELYNKGIKSIKPTFEQCLSLENVEINIPFKDYKQSYETIIVEYPEEYKSLLVSRYKRKAPLACTCHRPNDKEYMIGALSFGVNSYNITFFIANSETIIETLVSEQNEEQTKDPDFLPVKQAERVALNLMLLMTHFGYQKQGYENIKQHRFRERKKPELAKQDFYYYSLKQEIKLYTKKIITDKEIIEGTHASPKPHWRKGFWRQQHYGSGNSLTKLIFIQAVFVCSENYKGNLSDTEVIYK